MRCKGSGCELLGRASSLTECPVRPKHSRPDVLQSCLANSAIVAGRRLPHFGHVFPTTLKVLYVSVLLGLTACQPAGIELVLPTQATSAEREFGEKLQEAFARSDEKILMPLAHYNQPSDASLYADHYRQLVARKAKRIRLERIDAAQYTERKEGDTWVRESLPAKWLAIIEHPSEYNLHTDLYVGEQAGMLRFTTGYVIHK